MFSQILSLTQYLRFKLFRIQTGAHVLVTETVRPFGITVIVILEVLSGILGLGGGLLVLSVSSMIRFRVMLEIVLFALSVLFIAISGIQLFLSYGLWNGRSWAWIWTLIFAIVGVMLTLIGLVGGHFWNVVRLIGDALVIYYLNTPQVRTFFHRIPASAPLTVSP